MAKEPSREQFVEALTSSGLMSREEFAQFCQTQTDVVDASTDARGLARALIQHRKLTKYQASAVFQGKTRGLAFGEYVVLDKLGAGGMGQVFKARHRRMKRTVAIKVLPAEALRDGTAVDRFYQEVEAAAKLIHANIVTAFDAGETDGLHYLVMEYVPGDDLAKLVQKVGPLPVDTAVECVRQAARGLAFAHEHGVVHRDIKPANLLLATTKAKSPIQSAVRSPDSAVVKILDMGLARLKENEFGDAASPDRPGLTQSGQMMGTVDYMSPEQAEDTRTADHRADIYSLGVTLHRLLTGQPMYAGDTVMKRLLAHRNAPIPSLRDARADVPEALDAVFQKMVAKQPTQRQQSMDEVLAEIDAAMGAGPPPVDSEVADSDSSTAKALTAFIDNLDASPQTGQVATAAPPRVDETVDRIHPEEETGTVLQTNTATRPRAGARADARKKLLVPLLVAGGGVLSLLLLAAVTARLLMFGSWSADNTPPPGEEPQQVTPRGSEVGGRENFALSFDGVDDFVHIPALAFDDKSPMTLEAVFTPERADRHEKFVSFARDPNSIGISNKFDGTAWVGWHFGLQKVPFSKAKIEPGVPTHVALVVEGDEVRLYVNGQRQAAFVQETFESHLKFRPGLTLGVPLLNPDSFAKPYTGAIDEVRISNIARYTDNFTPAARHESDSHTLGLYHLDEGQGQKLIDSSPHGNDGRIGGSTWVKSLPVAALDDMRWALRFDGAAHVNVPTLKIGAVDTLTVEALVKADRLHHGMIVSNAEFGGFALKLDDDKWQFDGWDGEAQFRLESDQTAALGEWVHLAGVIQNGTARLYVDGQMQSSSARVNALKPSVLPIAIGANPEHDGVRNQFQGAMCLVRLSNTARYDGDFSPGEQYSLDEQTLALYRFYDGKDETLSDATRRHPGEIVDAQWMRPDEAAPLEPPPMNSTGGSSLDREAAMRVFALGGKVSVNEDTDEIARADNLPDGPFRLTGIHLDDSQIVSDSTLGGLGDCPNLRFITLAGARDVTDNGVAHLAAYSNLGAVHLGGTSATDNVFATLRQLPSLGYLDLSGTNVTDDGLAAAAELPQLAGIDLRRTEIGDAGLAHLGKRTGLAVVHLDGTKVTSAGLAHLQSCTILAQVTLAETDAANDVVEHLEKIPHLMILDLSDTKVDRGVIDQLPRLKSLQWLKLNRLDLQKTDIDRLHQQLPRCRIESDHGVVGPSQ